MRIDGMVFTLRLGELPCQPTAPGAWQPVPRIAPVGEQPVERPEQQTAMHAESEHECYCHPLDLMCGIGYIGSTVGLLTAILVTIL
jgi:hypothetical protein